VINRSGLVSAVLVSCLGVQLGFAQAKPGQRSLSFGPVAGINFATFTGSDASGAKTRTAFFVGGAINMPLGRSMFFQPQALYSMKGASIDLGGITGEYKLSYLEIPLLFGLRIPMQGSNVHPYVVAGPTIAFLMSCKIRASSGGLSAEANCDDSSIGLTTRSTDLGLSIGAGVELPMATGTLSLVGRYGFGLSGPFEGSNTKNSVISLGVGYFFGPTR
jgi:hypothetical protein